ncbi:hypothetical protein, variant [Verruconis gallopava]|uniref:arginyltransferase n=1 Tax=Verruconis gallopava TaxID=253628 RepID=A0A0D2A3R7_9PEZI|nr:hypothetical protein, variant [Verruconis gallopava]KIW01070.1 hypothetical protein, variant [Verruconis gallopava]
MQNILEKHSEPGVSLLTPIGYHTGDCGYCKQEDQSVSYYATAKQLTVDHYQTLVDRGWRRSGKLLYKPDLRHSCCPHYTIRLPVSEFKPRKDQRQAVNRWNKYVLGEEYQKEAARLRPRSKAEKARSRREFDLLSAIHESEHKTLSDSPLKPAHEFEVVLESDAFTEEKFNLYENYQRHVHHEHEKSISRNGFRRFLCSSPLKTTTRSCREGDIQRLGSFHQCYRLDGRLIAMAVLDLLPHCVSGVYFIYHSDFEKFSFGKISALREAALALEGGYQYYYMGYYIHSCKKMRYKNDYTPQYLLDLEIMRWNKLDNDVLRLLDTHHYLSLSLYRTNKSPRRRVFDSAQEAASAVRNGLSLFEVEFAGMLTAQELMATVDLDRVSIGIMKDVVVHGKDFVKWDEWSIHDSGENTSIKSAVAQLIACTGPEIADEIIVSFDG